MHAHPVVSPLLFLWASGLLVVVFMCLLIILLMLLIKVHIITDRLLLAVLHSYWARTRTHLLRSVVLCLVLLVCSGILKTVMVCIVGRNILIIVYELNLLMLLIILVRAHAATGTLLGVRRLL